ncbi:MAG: hypothetical protein AB1744_12545, partial [Candidatus Zixiibacteriota bacterium]
MIDEVTFSSDNPSVASVNPAIDWTFPYQTEVAPQGPGDTFIASDVISSGSPVCNAQATVNVSAVSAWWQVIDADVRTGGDLTSQLPGAEKFGLVGLGGFPGIPLYGGLTNLTTSNVSVRGWLVNTSNLSSRTYNYDYFAKQIPADTKINPVASGSVNGSFFASGGEASFGYYWYRFTGSSGQDLTING